LSSHSQKGVATFIQLLQVVVISSLVNIIVNIVIVIASSQSFVEFVAKLQHIRCLSFFRICIR